jgi:hypothetical protein
MSFPFGAEIAWASVVPLSDMVARLTQWRPGEVEPVRDIDLPGLFVVEHLKAETVTPVETYQAIAQVVLRGQTMRQIMEELRQEMPQCFRSDEEMERIRADYERSAKSQ